MLQLSLLTCVLEEFPMAHHRIASAEYKTIPRSNVQMSLEVSMCTV